MIIPTNFKNDLTSKDTNLIPIIFLGDYNVEGYDDTDQYIANGDLIPISTNSGQILSGRPWTFLPILLNVPSLKESIDIETRKYKISNVSLTLSNYKYDGIRFSERFDIKGLMNRECRIFWTSPTVENVSFFDLNAVIYNESDHYNRALQVYYGVVRRYTIDGDKIKITLEDRSQSTLHKDLPKDILEGESVPSKYRGKRIPMVFGEVDRSPAVLTESIESEEFDIQGTTMLIDSSVNAYGVNKGTEFLGYGVGHASDNGISVLEEHDKTIGFQGAHSFKASPIFIASGDGEVMFLPESRSTHIDDNGITITHNDDNYEINGNILKFNLSGQSDIAYNNTIATRILREIDKVQVAWNASTGGSDYGNTHNWYCYIKSDYTYFEGQYQYIGSLAGLSGEHDLNLPENYLSNFNQQQPDGTGTNFNAYNVGELMIDDEGAGTAFKWVASRASENMGSYFYCRFFLKPLNIDGTCRTFLIMNVENHAGDSEGTWRWRAGTGVTEEPNINADNFYLSDEDNWNPNEGTTIEDYEFGNSWNKVNMHQAYSIGTPKTTGGSTTDEMVCEITIYESHLFQDINIEDATNKDFYAHCKGRKNIGDTGYTRVTNMHEIINHIILQELNVPPEFVRDFDNDKSFWINETFSDQEFYEKLSGYYSGGYPFLHSFTVNEKINSKTLIEELASASPFIPRFSNLGEFRFDSIKLQYYLQDIVDTENNGRRIYAEDVISYKYDRTKIEDVKTKVSVRYKKNYMTGEYNEHTEPQAVSPETYGELFSYYGLPTDHSESELIVEDKRSDYIRDKKSANRLKDFLFYYHKNQHLKITVKVPLTYLNIEVGDTISFDYILGDVKPFGIDYSYNAKYGNANYIGQKLNGQQIFPLFIVTSTNKTMKFVQIECEQLHNLGGGSINYQGQEDACYNIKSWNYSEFASPDGFGCVGAENFIQNTCLWEYNPLGNLAGSEKIPDYSLNYVGDEVSVNDEDVFLMHQLEEAQNYWERGNTPKIFTYLACIWSDIVYHKIKNIIIQIQIGNMWVNAGQLYSFGGFIGNEIPDTIDVEITPNILASAPDEFGGLNLPYVKARFKFIFKNNPLPTFAGSVEKFVWLMYAASGVNAGQIAGVHPAYEWNEELDVSSNNVWTSHGNQADYLELTLSEELVEDENWKDKWIKGHEIIRELAMELRLTAEMGDQLLNLSEAPQTLLNSNDLLYSEIDKSIDIRLWSDGDKFRYSKFDMNGDGEFTILDLTMMYTCVISGHGTDAFQGGYPEGLEYCKHLDELDIDGDGIFTVIDYTMIMDILLLETHGE
tara:strand:- start:4327 stop:8220 length:3894 start_codon:yes stop_codon:yes gene_type:complete